MIETTQKLIRIGSSEGVTLTKNDLASLGAKRGDLLKLKVEVVGASSKHQKLMSEYDDFVKVYGDTLKNLADR
jgi:hypothetical protein